MFTVHTEKDIQVNVNQIFSHGYRLDKKDKCSHLGHNMCILAQDMEHLHCKVGRFEYELDCE